MVNQLNLNVIYSPQKKIYFYHTDVVPSFLIKNKLIEFFDIKLGKNVLRYDQVNIIDIILSGIANPPSQSIMNNTTCFTPSNLSYEQQKICVGYIYFDHLQSDQLLHSLFLKIIDHLIIIYRCKTAFTNTYIFFQMILFCQTKHNIMCLYI